MFSGQKLVYIRLMSLSVLAFIRKEIALAPTRVVRDIVILSFKKDYLSMHILCVRPDLYNVCDFYPVWEGGIMF